MRQKIHERENGWILTYILRILGLFVSLILFYFMKEKEVNAILYIQCWIV